MIALITKSLLVIRSCTTPEQVEAATRYCRLAMQRMDREAQYLIWRALKRKVTEVGHV